MNTIELMKQYCDYTNNFAKWNHPTPLTFSEWQHFMEDRRARVFPISRFSPAANATITFHVPADNEGIARRLSDQWLQKFEAQHYAQNDGTGRKLSPQAQKQRTKQLQERVKKQEQKEVDRLAKSFSSGELDISILIAALQQA